MMSNYRALGAHHSSTVDPCAGIFDKGGKHQPACQSTRAPERQEYRPQRDGQQPTSKHRFQLLIPLTSVHFE